MFAHGILYVALSRIRSLDGLEITKVNVVEKLFSYGDLGSSYSQEDACPGR